MNKRTSFESKGYQLNEYIKLRNLYVNKKYSSLLKKSTEYLNYYPEDINIRFMKAKALRYLEKFDEAIEELKINLSIDRKDRHSIVELYYVYYYLNMYNEALELLPQLYENEYMNKQSLAFSEMIMKKSLGIDMKVKEERKKQYLYGQIFDYDKNRALEHIKQHADDNEKQRKETSEFNSNINIDYLFECVKENLKLSKKANSEEILEVYYFGISNIGYSSNNNISNYLKVVVIPNTNNIISMYPINSIDTTNISPLTFDSEKLFIKKEEKVKRISQIDKFNNRFKRV